MTQPQYIRDLLDLPESVPRCVVEINTFDAPGELRNNVEDYVITDTVAEELRGLVDRIVASVRRHEPGEGHYVHGAFGSGKSHFMGILGLILSDNPVIWEKDHPVIREIQAEHGDWLAENPILVVPIYMLGKKIPFQYAMYESANERLRQLGYPPCRFSEAGARPPGSQRRHGQAAAGVRLRPGLPISGAVTVQSPTSEAEWVFRANLSACPHRQAERAGLVCTQDVQSAES